MSHRDPSSATLWEMFREWLRSLGSNGKEVNLPDICRNLLDLPPGLPVEDLDVKANFPDSLVVLASLRHVVRRVMGQDFHFADYVLRVTPKNAGDGPPTNARLRATADGPRLLLRLHDEFGFAEDFLAVVNDKAGFFQIDDDPCGVPVRFERLNGMHGAWKAGVYEQQDQDHDGKFDEGNLPFYEIEFWDFIRTCAAGREEFLFVEINQTTGWTQLWRGFPC